MLKNLDSKKVLPYLLSIIVFLVLSYGYFSPILDGKQLNQHDLKTFKGGAQELIDYRERTGEEALWSNSMFAGMPAYLNSTRYKGNLLQHLNNLLLFGKRPASQLFLLLLGGFILFISLRINPWLSLVGAIALAFSTYNFIILFAGHNSKVIAIAYVAPALAGIFLAIRGKRILGAAIAGIFLSLQVLAGHPQITYYMIFIVLAFGISELVFAIQSKKVLELTYSVGVLVIVVIFAAMSNYSRLATTMEYDDYSMRSETELTIPEEERTGGLTRSYATSWSYGVKETFTVMIPGFMGGSSTYALGENSETFEALSRLDRNFARSFTERTNMYWGPQTSTSGPVYFGVVIVFFFVLGMFILNGRHKWWILGVSLLAIVLSWGRNFPGLTDFFMNNIPGYNKFRTVSMTLVIPQITFPLLALITLKEIIFGDMDKKRLLYGLKWSAGIVGGLSLLFFLFPALAGTFSSPNDLLTVNAISGGNPEVRSLLVDTLIPALETDRQSMLRTDAFRSLIFVLLSGGLIYFTQLGKLKMSTNLLIAAIGILVLADLWPVNKRFLNDDHFSPARSVEVPFQATTADNAILSMAGLNERVLNLTVSTFQDASTSYFHQSLGGYHGAKMRRYQDLIDTKLVEDMQSFIRGYQSQDFMRLDSVMAKLNIINMLNTRFIILDPNAEPLVNRYAAGNAWFVNEILVADSADEELEITSTLDLETQAVTDRRFEEQIKQFTFETPISSRITLDSYEPNRLEYSSSSSTDGFAVFSEIFYKEGWNAYLNGEPVDHIQVNYLLRGMFVPAGDHTIVFEFRPKSYINGEKVSIAGSVLLILVFAGGVYAAIRDRKEEEQE